MNKTNRIAVSLAALATIGTFHLSAEAKKPAAYDAQRCINLGNTFEPPRDAEYRMPMKLGDFKIIADAGFDTVRIPVRWVDFSQKRVPYSIEADYLAEVKSAVDAALAADLNVILNVHTFEDLRTASSREVARVVAIWRQIATTFSAYPDDLWFEVMNFGDDDAATGAILAGQKFAYDTIRTSNPDRIIFVNGVVAFDTAVTESTLFEGDTNIVYSVHYFEPFEFTHQTASWVEPALPGGRKWGEGSDASDLVKATEEMGEIVRLAERPMMVRMFGAYEGVPIEERVAYIEDVRKAFEAQDVQWCAWSFENTFFYHHADEGWNPDLLRALGL